MIAQSQSSALSGAADLDKSLQQSVVPQISAADAAKEQAPIDGIIAPDRYLLGPGDALSIYIQPFPGVEQPLTVSADNSIILPRIGMLSLYGKTLAQARDTIAKIYALRNTNSLVALSLRRARTIYCTIRGNVQYPGLKAYSAATHISSVIAFANQPPNSTAIKPAAAKNIDNNIAVNAASFDLSSYAARNITVLHRDGTSENVDLYKAKYGGTPESDPTIREGDDILVPFGVQSHPTISIGGAVRRPIALAYSKGDKVSLLLRAGHGLRDDADIGNITLTMQDGSQQSIALNNKGELAQADISLQPGAALIVGFAAKTGVSEQGISEITGEVAHPGAYPITKNQTRLKDIVAQAGGFTKNAYLPLAYIVRREKSKTNIEIEKPNWQSIQYTDLTFEDTTRLIMHNALKRSVASSDFVKAFQENLPENNILLNDGDIIVVPENPRSVYVYGQVQQPGYVEFFPGKRMQWYIDKAGGYSVGAEKNLSRIIKGKNKTWEKDDDNVFVEAGDEVYVAPPTNVPAGYDLQLYALIGTLLTTMAFLASTFIGLFKK